ncbi:MAG: hypothetical protein ABH868_01755 [bacterium]
MNHLMFRDKRGFGILLPVATMVILIVLGLALTFLISHERQKQVKSDKSNLALYLADAGVERVLYEFKLSTGPYTFAGTETFLPDNADPDGSFIVSISSSAGVPGKWDIAATGYVPDSTSPNISRRIQVKCEKLINPITVTSALAAGGDVRVGGSAEVDGSPLAGVVVPAGSTATTQGGGQIIGSPPTATAPFPSFEEIFGITEQEMENIASTKYNLPANNAAATGITWCNGDFMVTTSGWTGSGVLVVKGDFKMTGGLFTGIIYVEGSFMMSGNANVSGGIFSQNTADIELTTGNSELQYDSTAVDNAGDLYPYKVISWEEIYE